MPPTLFLVAAVADEIAPLLRRGYRFQRTERGWSADVDGAPVRLRLTGVGFARARAAARQLAGEATPADLVISTGFCGALAPTLPAGTLVHSERAVICEADRVPVVVDGLAPAPTLPGGPSLAEGDTLTVPRVVHEPEERRRWRNEYRVDVVEMESGLLAQACRAARIPCCITRIVLDTPNAPMRVDYNAIPTAHGDLRVWDVLRWWLRHPLRLPDLLADRRLVRTTAEHLGDWLAAVVRAHAARTQATPPTALSPNGFSTE